MFFFSSLLYHFSFNSFSFFFVYHTLIFSCPLSPYNDNDQPEKFSSNEKKIIINFCLHVVILMLLLLFLCYLIIFLQNPSMTQVNLKRRLIKSDECTTRTNKPANNLPSNTLTELKKAHILYQTGA